MANKEKFSNLSETEISCFSSDHLAALSQSWLQVEDVMSSDVTTISSEQSVSLATRLMSEKNISCIVIVDDRSVEGIVTETDLLRKVVGRYKNLDKVSVSEIMSSPVETVSPHLSVLDAGRIA